MSQVIDLCKAELNKDYIVHKIKNNNKVYENYGIFENAPIVPCNGRFPTLISIITIFMTSYFSSKLRSLVSALILTGFIILSIIVSMGISFLLSKTILKNGNKDFVYVITVNYN
jgi:Golgi nucleoside diphosphatase